jgi:hypothetical protein
MVSQERFEGIKRVSRRTDNTMTKQKRTGRQTMVGKIIHKQ